jgi:hypothetical protein
MQRDNPWRDSIQPLSRHLAHGQSPADPHATEKTQEERAAAQNPDSLLYLIMEGRIDEKSRDRSDLQYCSSLKLTGEVKVELRQLPRKTSYGKSRLK